MKESPLKSPLVVLLSAFILLFGAVPSASDSVFAQTTKIRDQNVDLNAQNPFAIRTARDAATPSPTAKLVPRNVSDVANVPPNAPSDGGDVLLLKSGERLVGSVEKISGLGGVSFRVSPQKTARLVSTVDVERIETPVGSEFRRGVAAFESGLRSGQTADFRRALAAFQAARQAETRRWVREWATAKIVDSLVALGRADEAANEFFLLARLDPYSAFLTSIPLRWSNRTTFERAFANSNAEIDGSTENSVAIWLDKKNPLGAQNPVGRLLAASILLNSAKHKETAISALQDLVVSSAPAAPIAAVSNSLTNANDGPISVDADAAQTSRTIVLLATAQLWRLSLLKTPTEREADRWTKTLALFPNELRLGPTFLVARANAALGRNDAARRAFLQVALLATSDRELAEQATKNAADALERAGNETDAARLRADLSARFAE